MNADPQDRLIDLLTEALERASTAERAHYLETACAGDAELRRQVDSLLVAHERAGGFLQQPAAPPAENLIGEELGSVIGHYRLQELIGEGGFGRVYLAEQLEPVRRRVALKIIKAGMDTGEVVARFKAERQALAMMDHPHIAKVFDAGTTKPVDSESRRPKSEVPSGRPYFVMELVKGVPITEYCDAHRLSTQERLALFAEVCHAVQHAHQKGVIHRDLKPTNVLVASVDGRPVPKVIDFGVAKAIGESLTERTGFTRFDRMIGTPAYMSPEQAALSGVDVDTRADIYSLGALLYKLLTGTTPFESDALKRAAWDEVCRLIRDTEPPRPSTRLKTLGDGIAQVAQRRQAAPPALTRLVRGDLDWIVTPKPSRTCSGRLRS